VRSALESLAEIGVAESRRTVAVLGEMKELGPSSAREHEALGALIADAGVAVAIGCGGLIDLALDRAAARGVTVIKATSTADAVARAREIVIAKDVVLVKGSRSVGVERVVEALVELHGGSVDTATERR
jgi:UDP-N-acetylmuramoyl-tripeptide--D-alanyl-D-alanine ligase